MTGVVLRLPRAVAGRADRVLPGGRTRVVLAIVAVLLALASLAGVAVLAFSTVDSVRREQAGQEALEAVRDMTPKFLNFDHRNIDADIARSRSVTTDEYWSQNTLGKQFKQAIIGQEASTKTVVRAAGVADAEPGRVDVLVFLDQTTAGKDLPQPRVDPRVARVTATSVDGTWRIAGFKSL